MSKEFTTMFHILTTVTPTKVYNTLHVVLIKIWRLKNQILSPSLIHESITQLRNVLTGILPN